LGILFFSILCTCPNHRNLCNVICKLCHRQLFHLWSRYPLESLSLLFIREAWKPSA
jgi:hypothetical protein